MIPGRTPSPDETLSEVAPAPLPGAPGMEARERKEAIAEERASDASRLFVPPAEGASGKGVALPPKLLSFALDVGAEAYGRLGNFEAAMNIMKRRLKERWSAEKGASGYVFKERTHPLDEVLQEWKRGSQGSVHERSGGKPATTHAQGSSESDDVAEARKRWDAAKASGDPDAMTRAANDLLRVVEAEQAAQGKSTAAQTEGGRHPTSEVLAPEGSREGSRSVGDAIAASVGEGARVTVDVLGSLERSPHEADTRKAVEPVVERWLDNLGLYVELDDFDSGLTARFHDKHLRGVADLIAGRPLAERGEVLRAFEERFGRENATALAQHLTSNLETGVRGAPNVVLAGLAYQVGNDEQLGAPSPQDQRPRASDEYPERPGEGMDRVRRAERRGAQRRRERGQRHWVDPDVGWDESTARETLAAAAGKPLSVETLLVWSHEVYMEERGGLLPSQRIPPGWEKVDEINDEESGYYAIAVRDKLTGTVVIINRGTTITDTGDRVASTDIFAGRETRQLLLAREFLVRVYEINRRTGKSGKIVVTGHSLGSACAQVQLAAAHYDRRLRGKLTDISGVGFASVGAKGAISAIQRSDPHWRDGDTRSFEAFARDRFVNYTRRGDGIVVDRERKRGRSESLGDTVWLDAIDERGLAADEASLRREPNWWEAESWEAKQSATMLRIKMRHIKNHSLRSMYHPDFLDPLDRVLERRRSGSPRGVH